MPLREVESPSTSNSGYDFFTRVAGASRHDQISSIHDLFRAPTDVQDAYPSSGIVELVRNEFLSLEQRFSERIASFENKVQLRLNLLEDENASKSQHLSELYNIVRSHDSALLEIAENPMAITIRRHLDDARLIIGRGYEVVFPSFFKENLIMNCLDKTYQSLDWAKFQNLLWNFYTIHHEVVSAGNPERKASFWQKQSALEFCSRRLLLDYEVTSEKADYGYAATANPEERLPRASVLPSSFVAYWNKDRERPIHPMEDKQTLTVDQGWELAFECAFNFFLPAFIWAIHELHDAIKLQRNTILDYQRFLERERESFFGAHGHTKPFVSDTFAPLEETLILADDTAAEIRKSPEWQALVEEAVKKLEKMGNWDNICPHAQCAFVPANFGDGTKRIFLASSKRARDYEHQIVDRMAKVPKTMFQSNSSNRGNASTTATDANTVTLHPDVEEIRRKFVEENPEMPQPFAGYFFKMNEAKYLAIINARKKIPELAKKLETVSKTFAILVDKKLMDFVVYKSSIVSFVANGIVHKPNSSSAVVVEAIRNAIEVVFADKEFPDVKMSKSEVLDLLLQSLRLYSLFWGSKDLSDGDNLKDKIAENKGKGREEGGEEFSLQESMNKYLTAEARKQFEKAEAKPKRGDKGSGPDLNDFMILMKWLDDVNEPE